MQTMVLVSGCLQGMVAFRHTNDKITHICSLHIEEQAYQSATMAVEINKMDTDINIPVLDEVMPTVQLMYMLHERMDYKAILLRSLAPCIIQINCMLSHIEVAQPQRGNRCSSVPKQEAASDRQLSLETLKAETSVSTRIKADTDIDIIIPWARYCLQEKARPYNKRVSNRQLSFFTKSRTALNLGRLVNKPTVASRGAALSNSTTQSDAKSLICGSELPTNSRKTPILPPKSHTSMIQDC
jgi:hypothetical protein